MGARLDRELTDALHAHGAEVGHQVQAQMALFGDHILGANFELYPKVGDEMR